MRKMLFLLVSAGLVGGSAVSARAADVIVNDDAGAPAWVYRHGDYRLAPRDRFTVRSDGPMVYGSYRPDNCGVFHYWDGDACVDARYDPPRL